MTGGTPTTIREAGYGPAEQAASRFMGKQAPCPFCGSRNVDVAHPIANKHFAQCRSCSCSGPVGCGRAEAWALWNKRTA